MQKGADFTQQSLPDKNEGSETAWPVTGGQGCLSSSGPGRNLLNIEDSPDPFFSDKVDLGSVSVSQGGAVPVYFDGIVYVW